MGESFQDLERESASRPPERTPEELRALVESLFRSQDDERRRVARELHDNICQKLAMLEIHAAQLQQQAGPPHPVREGLEELQAAAAALAEEARRISRHLHPSAIEDLGIAAALRSLVEEFGEREGMSASFAAQDVPEGISTAKGTGLYRIAQEALCNVARHAGPTRVQVVLRRAADSLHLQVIDSGKGFHVKEGRSGLGLIGMAERARLLGGTFQVDSKPGEGTHITVDLPLEKRS